MTISKLKISFLALMISGLAACASAPTPYKIAADADAAGYRDTQIEDNRFRVSYRANDPALAREFAIRRAAELTLQNGYDWFEVSGSDSDTEKNSSGTSLSVGGSTGSYGRRSGTSVGVGVGIPLGGSSSDTLVTMEVLMHKGDKPDAANAYDARSVLENIGR